MAKVLTTGKVAQVIMRKLKRWKPRIYHLAVTSNSVYIKFRSVECGSLRISDHDGREKYSYRWRVRVDVPSRYWHEGEHNGIPYVECGVGRLGGLVKEFERQAGERGLAPVREYKFIIGRKYGRG